MGLAAKNAKSAKKTWPMVRLGDVCEIVLGGTPSTKNPEYWGGGIPWLTPGEMRALKSCYVEHTERTLTQAGLAAGSRLCPARSVVLSTRAPIGYVFINLVPMATNQGCKTLVLKQVMLAEYLYYNLLGRTEELNALGTGTTFKELATKSLFNLSIPLPPLSVQREIVARLEKELGEADALAVKFKEIAENADAEFKAELDEAFKNVEGEKVRLGDVCDTVATRGHQIKQSEIGDEGRFPVVSQSENDIEGYTNIEVQIQDVPLVLFGDHTCCAKLVEFPFVVGADGTKLIKSESVDIRYLFRFVQWVSNAIIDGKYRRHFADLMNSEIVISDNQFLVVSKLDEVQDKCEKLKAAAERGFRAAEDLRKAILAEAFEQ